MRQIYLDYNATTPVAPTVFEAMRPYFTDHYGNPSSTHVLGLAASQAIEDAREKVAMLIGANVDEVFFTANGTESNNLAIKGVCQTENGYSGHIIISAIEHPATLEPAKFLQRMGCDVSIVGTDKYGVVDPDEVAKHLRDDTRLISIMHANNEIGTIQPIREIADLVKDHETLVHTDAAQSIGKIRAHVNELRLDMMTIAGHKLYAPKGIGALYVRSGTKISPIIHGAGHEQGLRPSTENTPYIVGLGAAATLALRSLDENRIRIRNLRDELYSRLATSIEGLSFNGPEEGRLPNTLSVNFPRVVGAELLAECQGIFASTGSACHSGTTNMSNTLKAIGLPEEVARGTVRLSLGWNTSQEEIQIAADTLISAWESMTS
ncbi:MAG: cysteine desulfurase [Planctomycetales bacterium]|nr:cysteine desulfurase [Planctomycetales bacterium]